MEEMIVPPSDQRKKGISRSVWAAIAVAIAVILVLVVWAVVAYQQTASFIPPSNQPQPSENDNCVSTIQLTLSCTHDVYYSIADTGGNQDDSFSFPYGDLPTGMLTAGETKTITLTYSWWGHSTTWMTLQIGWGQSPVNTMIAEQWHSYPLVVLDGGLDPLSYEIP